MPQAAALSAGNDTGITADALSIRARVRNAADAIAPVWPLKTFIACNPLQGFEGLPFEQAVKEGEILFGGRGYRPADEYRRRYVAGEVSAAAVKAAIRRRLPGPAPTLGFGGRTLAAEDVLFAHIVRRPPQHLPAPGALADAAGKATAGLQDRPRPGEDNAAKPDERQWQPERETVAGWIDRLCGTRHVAAINRQAIKWCAAFLDEGQAAVPMPGREAGLFAAWRRLAVHDASVPGLVEVVAALPASADASIVSILGGLGVVEAESEACLRAHLAALPGWAGFIKWRADSPNYAWQKRHPADLVEYLAIRLAVEQALVTEYAGAQLGCAPTLAAIARRVAAVPAAGARQAAVPAPTPAARLHHLALHLRLSPQTLAQATAEEVRALLALVEAWPSETHAPVWLEAAEETYRGGLAEALASVARRLASPTMAKPRAEAQLVFCIDVRSEPFRRALEAVGDYETYGFAGFFGIPIRFAPFAGEAPADLCPVLLQPRHDVTETPDPAAAACARRHLAGIAAERGFKSLVGSLKGNIAAPFAFVESVGALSGVAFAGRTMSPLAYGRSVSAFRDRLQPPVPLRPVLDLTPKRAPCNHDHDHDHDTEDLWGLTLEEQAFYAAAGAQIMGLSAPFAEFVVLCAHGSTSTNNPYAAALDCGACGGNHGGPNARVMAAIFNRPEVRALLAEQGVDIPASTLFLAAEHNTTTDEVTIFNTDSVPESHRTGLARLQRDLLEARRINAANRRKRLPEADAGAGESGSADTHVAERSLDWAQVRPEWGLARNAAFIVGPRALTAGTDLDGRCFLHSYDWRTDEDAKSLEIILTAPMVVAQWINCQYYFSTVDNEHYGSGNKVTLNVTGRIGVMQGNASDLMAGLPWQSVMAAEGEPYHEPLRLMTVVMAPVGRLATLIARNTILQRLFDNEWVALLVIDPETGRFLRYRHGRTWSDMTPGLSPPADDALVPEAPGNRSSDAATATTTVVHDTPAIPA